MFGMSPNGGSTGSMDFKNRSLANKFLVFNALDICILGVGKALTRCSENAFEVAVKFPGKNL